MNREYEEIPNYQKPTADIWLNLYRFYDKKIPPLWAIASHFYFGVRREYSKEIMNIINGGGDVHSKINQIKDIMEK